MRNFSTNELQLLTAAGCWAQDWASVYVEDDFKGIDRISDVRFYGHVELAGFEADDIELVEGLFVASGLRNATLCDCRVGYDVLIDNVSGLVRGYDIEERVILQSVGTLDMDVVNGSSFGNGVSVAVLDETGSREVVIYDSMSAQMAYIMAVGGYADSVGQRIRKKMCGMANEQKEEGCRALIGKGSRVVNVQFMRNVKVGEYAIINGALRLENGTVNSDLESPSIVGAGVVAKDFIMSTGSKVDSGASLCRVFVGQASILTQGFTAHDCVFLSNCVMENGEACAVMAGPFAVSMHKSSLLIGMMTSFSNFGSGSNQSNHLYKLGPIHFGVLERGTKLSSNSYVMFPAHIGAFSVVIGSHYSHLDSSRLPYSYVVEGDAGRSRVMPARNFVTSGTLRDVAKWPNRDKRVSDIYSRADLLTFDVSNPYMIERVLCAHKFLVDNLDASLQEIKGDWSSALKGDCYITQKDARYGVELYEMALVNYVGDKLIDRLIKGKMSVGELINFIVSLSKNNFVGESEFDGMQWVDVAGAVFSRDVLNQIKQNITSGDFLINELEQKIKTTITDDSVELEWENSVVRYVIDTVLCIADKSRAVQSLVDRWHESKLKYYNMVLSDARKEFEQPFMKIGFGSDLCTNSSVDIDFNNTRGKASDNSFIQSIEIMKASCNELYMEINKKLSV